MPIQIVPVDNSRAQQQLLTIDLIGRSLGQIGQAFEARRQLAERQAEKNALISALMGGVDPGASVPAPGAGPIELPGARLTAAGDLAPATIPASAPAPAPATFGGLTPEQLEGLPANILGQMFAQRFAAPPSPVEVSPGASLVDPRSGTPLYTAPAAPKPPMMRDRLEGSQRIFEQYDPATGRWIELSRGPAFRQPDAVNVINAPSGYRVTPEGGLEPIPGGPAERVEGPAAAGLTLLPNAIAEIPGLRGALFNPDGTLNRQAVATMNAPGIGSIPGTAGEGYRASMQAGTMAILRVESGGAITDEEIANKLETYMPGPFDTNDVARQKFDRYERDLNNALQTLSRGRGGMPEVPPVPRPAPATGPVDRVIGQGVEAAREAVAPQAGQQVGPDQLGEGEIIRNPLTGEMLIVRDGKLVPYGG